MPEQMNLTMFKEKVFDYEQEKEWKFKGDRPAIIDFYADWCGPCRMVGPVLEKIGTKYSGKLDVYKVDTDVEQELAGMFGVQSIPTLVFIPKDGNPMVSVGALPEKEIDRIVKEELNVS
ncbi:MAG TPA: thioredoxin [Spirochaetia bacterium]|nr:thioredoxin [Spirochaetales bacterium]HRS66473.1 thioredoxin [Spirochaetia bacterium]HOT59015.1 thioredoxin [Spirochaetales bacterium]HPD80102.1 thioredoxin [Spirochaetales bacterium]HQK35079.1 thioredoxin [Spirochaetales bacterium]